MNDVKTTNSGLLRILSTTIGSRAHGMETELSDHDMRAVDVLPTSKLLSLTADNTFTRKRGTFLDEDFWELQRFIELALKGDTIAFEVLLGPVEFATPEGEELRALYPKFLQRERICNSFLSFRRRRSTRLRSVLSRDL